MTSVPEPASVGRAARSARSVPWAPILVLLAAAWPFVAGDAHTADLGRIAATDAIFVAGCVVVVGIAGQLSLAQAALYGVGAYVSACLTTRSGVDPMVALPLAVAAGAVAGAVLGLASLRVRGDQLAVVTLAAGIVAQLVFLNWTPVTGGFSGIPGVPAPSVAGTVLADDTSLYVLSLVVLGAVCLAIEVLRRSRLGRAMRAVQADELQAHTLGIGVGRTKLAAFAISGAIAGAAGWLYAVSVGYVSSAGFGITVSVLGVVPVLVAGVGRLYTALLVAAALAVLQDLTKGVAEVELAATGLAVLLAVLWRARGTRATVIA